MDMMQAQSRLKDLSDDQLVQQMQRPDGTAPQFLVLTELKRRRDMRKASALDQPQQAPLAQQYTQEMSQGLGQMRGFQNGGYVAPIPMQLRGIGQDAMGISQRMRALAQDARAARNPAPDRNVRLPANLQNRYSDYEAPRPMRESRYPVGRFPPPEDMYDPSLPAGLQGLQAGDTPGDEFYDFSATPGGADPRVGPMRQPGPYMDDGVPYVPMEEGRVPPERFDPSEAVGPYDVPMPPPGQGQERIDAFKGTVRDALTFSPLGWLADQFPDEVDPDADPEVDIEPPAARPFPMEISEEGEPTASTPPSTEPEQAETDSAPNLEGVSEDAGIDILSGLEAADEETAEAQQDYYAGVEEKMRKILAGADERKQSAINYGLMEAGLGIMASDSPYALQAVGEGGLPALKGVRDAIRAESERETQFLPVEADIATGRARQAESAADRRLTRRGQDMDQRYRQTSLELERMKSMLPPSEVRYLEYLQNNPDALELATQLEAAGSSGSGELYKALRDDKERQRIQQQYMMDSTPRYQVGDQEVPFSELPAAMQEEIVNTQIIRNLSAQTLTLAEE